MYNLGADINNLLMEFLYEEVSEKVLHGISYIIVSKADSNKKRVEKLNHIRKVLSDEGVPEERVFRRYALLNGYIYDMELEEAVDLTVNATTAMASEGKLGNDFVGDMGIRKIAMGCKLEDLQLLCRKCVDRVRKGSNDLDVVLYSRNRSPQVIITGKREGTNEAVAIRYDAFALRHTDIEELNREHLRMQGLIVTKVIAHEIVPGSRGVLFTLKLARADI